MRNIAIALVALAAGLLAASQLSPDAHAQGTLNATTIPPRYWPPLPEDMLATKIEFSLQLAPGEEVQAYRVPAGRWLVLLDANISASGAGVVRLFASSTSSSPQTEVGVSGLTRGVGGAPFGLACAPSSRIYAQNSPSNNDNETLSAVSLWGYLVDDL